jgi:hypothetical protein
MHPVFSAACGAHRCSYPGSCPCCDPHSRTHGTGNCLQSGRVMLFIFPTVSRWQARVPGRGGPADELRAEPWPRSPMVRGRRGGDARGAWGTWKAVVGWPAVRCQRGGGEAAEVPRCIYGYGCGSGWHWLAKSRRGLPVVVSAVTWVAADLACRRCAAPGRALGPWAGPMQEASVLLAGGGVL